MGGSAIASLFVSIGADLTNLTSGLDQTESLLDKTQGRLSSIGHALGGALATGAAVGVGAVVGLGAVALKTGFDFLTMKENAQTAFSTMLGDGGKAKALMSELQQFAASTPFEFEELATAGKSLLAFGTAADKVVPTMRRLGDIAAGVNVPIGEMAELYGKAQVSGRLFAEDINQLTGRGIPIIQELAKQFGVTDSEVKQLVEDGAVGFDNLERAFISLTSTGGKFSAMMEAQSKTFSGMMSTLKDTLTQIAGALSKPFFDVAKGGMEKLIGFLNSPEVMGKIQDVADGISSVLNDISVGDFSGAFATIREGLETLVPPGVLDTLESIGSAAKNGFVQFQSWLDENGPLIEAKAIGLGQNIKSWWDENGEGLLQGSDLPFTKLRNSISGVFDTITTDGEKSKSDFAGVVATWNVVMQTHEKDFDKVKTKLADGWNSIQRAIGRALDQQPVDDFNDSLDKWGIKLPTSVQLFDSFAQQMVSLGEEVAAALNGIAAAIDAVVAGAKAAQEFFDGPGSSLPGVDNGGGINGGPNNTEFMSGGRGRRGATVVIENINYAPTVSLMDEAEAETKLKPFIRDAVMAALA